MLVVVVDVETANVVLVVVVGSGGVELRRFGDSANTTAPTAIAITSGAARITTIHGLERFLPIRNP